MTQKQVTQFNGGALVAVIPFIVLFFIMLII